MPDEPIGAEQGAGSREQGEGNITPPASEQNPIEQKPVDDLSPLKPIVGGDKPREARGGTEDKKPEDKKPEEEPKPEDKKQEPRAPEEYGEFKLPEGATLDEQGITEFKGLAKELDLTQEQAQKVLDFGGEKIKAMTEAPHKLWAETQAKWQAEVKADPEIGGTKFQDSVKTTALVFEPSESNPFVGSADEAKSLREALNATGAGNNPAIVKLFVKMGNVLKEPGSLTGKPVLASQATLLDKLYPTMTGA